MVEAVGATLVVAREVVGMAPVVPREAVGATLVVALVYLQQGLSSQTDAFAVSFWYRSRHSFEQKWRVSDPRTSRCESSVDTNMPQTGSRSVLPTRTWEEFTLGPPEALPRDGEGPKSPCKARPNIFTTTKKKTNSTT